MGWPQSINGVGTQARFSFPTDVEVDADGNIFVVDSGSEKLRKISPTGLVTTIGYKPEGFFRLPLDLAVSPNGRLLVADTGNNRISSSIENVPPVIKLFGENPLKIYKGGSFDDPGAIVTDDHDSIRAILGSGTVETNKLGIYDLTYATSDSSDLEAIPRVLKVQVILGLDGDEDGDGLSNKLETELGSNPVVVDSDGDGFSDAVEYYFGSSLVNSAEIPSSKWPYFSRFAGTYIGNFGTTDLADLSEALLRNGQLLITLTSKSQFTGTLMLNGRKVGFRGRFDPNGNWKGAVTVEGRPVEVEMLLEGGELGNRVSCSVTSDTEQAAALTLLPAAHTGAKGDEFVWSGARINLLLASAGISGNRFGYGYAGAVFSKDGVLRLTGKLADNSPWSGTARVVRDEAGDLRLPLAILISSTRGLLHGEGTLDLGADVQAGEAEFYSLGTWTWVRGANSRGKSYKDGFVEGLQPLGQRWVYQRGSNLWNDQSAATNVQLLLGTDSGAVGPFITAGQLNKSPAWSPALPRGFQLAVTSARGEISGKIPARSGGNAAPAASYGGVLLSPGVTRGKDILLGGGFLFSPLGSDVVELTDQGQ